MLKNLILDMGGVLLRYEPRYFLRRVGITDEADIELLVREVFFSKNWAQTDLGYLDEAGLEERVRPLLPERLWDVAHQMIFHWNEPVEAVPGMADFIRESKALGLKVYLLSNVSHRIDEYWHTIPGSELFDGRVISARLHMVKPQPEIFAHLLGKFGLSASECLFVDDMPQNAEAAVRCGLHGFAFSGDMDALRAERDRLMEETADSEAAAPRTQAAPILTDEFRAARLTLTPGRINHMVLDTDTFNEEDDQFALAYAAKAHAHGRLVLEAVYAAPYSHDRVKDPAVGMELSFGEIHHILSLVGMDDGSIPVLHGADRFLSGQIMDWAEMVKRKGWHFEPLPDPTAPVDCEAVRDLIRRAMDRPADDPLYVCVTGCPVTLASALLMEPRIKEKIVVIFLGGHDLDWPDCFEFNLRQDLISSRVLLDSGVPLFLLPAYKTVQALRTTTYELDRFLDGKSEIGSYLAGLVRKKYADFHPGHIAAEIPWAASKVIWDVAAPAVLLHPEYTVSKLVPAPGIDDDYRWTFPEGRHLIRVLTNIWRDDVFTDLFHELTAD